MKVEYGELTEEALVGYGKDVERARDRYEHRMAHAMDQDRMPEECEAEYADQESEEGGNLIFGLVGLMIALIAFLGILAPLVSAFADVVSWTATP